MVIAVAPWSRKGGTENGSAAAALDIELNVLGFLGEVLATPYKATFRIANEVVEIDLSVLQVPIDVAKAGPQDVAVVDTDVFGGVVEAHGDGLNWDSVVQLESSGFREKSVGERDLVEVAD